MGEGDKGIIGKKKRGRRKSEEKCVWKETKVENRAKHSMRERGGSSRP